MVWFLEQCLGNSGSDVHEKTALFQDERIFPRCNCTGKETKRTELLVSSTSQFVTIASSAESSAYLVVSQHHYHNYNYYKMLQSRAVAAGEYWKQYLQFGQQLKYFSPFSAFRKVLNTQSFLFKSILIMVIWDKTPQLGLFYFLNVAVELTVLSFSLWTSKKMKCSGI